MTALCQYLMPTGKTCQSPALSGQPLCFHHDRAAVQDQFSLNLPPLTSRESILLALSQVALAVGLNQLDTKRANLLLRSMNLATRLIAGCEKEAKAAALPVVLPEKHLRLPAPAAAITIQSPPAHRTFAAPPHHANDRLPRSLREKVDAIQRANR
jgi:hypothetical protein